METIGAVAGVEALLEMEAIGGAVAEREALGGMMAVADFEPDFSVNNNEIKAASSSFLFILLLSLFLVTFLGFMVARRRRRNTAKDQPDEEQQQMLHTDTNSHQLETDTNHNPTQHSRHCSCLYTLKTKFIFGTCLAFGNFVLEIPSAIMDQMGSETKPTYALIIMLLSFTSMLICLVELVCKGKSQKITWKWRSRSRRIPWFYHPLPADTPFGTFTDIIGLICAMTQCVVTAINYVFCVRDHSSPVKIQVWPPVFAFGLLCSKFMGS